MLSDYENVYHQIENEHWWHISRRDMIINLIDWQELDINYKILDIGCSSGRLIKDITNITNAKVYGIDSSTSAIREGKKNGLDNIFLMNGESTTFDDNLFDIVIASDCLEHIKSDSKALIEWNRILKPNGKLIIFVPAWKSLWSNLDIASQHFRRYSFSKLKLKLTKAGFKISRVSFWNILLFIPILIFRKIESLIMIKSSKKIQLSLPSKQMNDFFKKLLKFENNIIKKYNSPIGVSLFAICVKETYEN